MDNIKFVDGFDPDNGRCIIKGSFKEKAFKNLAKVLKYRNINFLSNNGYGYIMYSYPFYAHYNLEGFKAYYKGREGFMNFIDTLGESLDEILVLERDHCGCAYMDISLALREVLDKDYDQIKADYINYCTKDGEEFKKKLIKSAEKVLRKYA